MAGDTRNTDVGKLGAEVPRLTGTSETKRLADELEEIAEHCAGLPMLDDRPVEQILGYREDGLPGTKARTDEIGGETH